MIVTKMVAIHNAGWALFTRDPETHVETLEIVDANNERIALFVTEEVDAIREALKGT